MTRSEVIGVVSSTFRWMTLEMASTLLMWAYVNLWNKSLLLRYEPTRLLSTIGMCRPESLTAGTIVAMSLESWQWMTAILFCLVILLKRQTALG